MRIVVSRKPPDARSLARWASVRTNSPPDGPPSGVADNYEADVLPRTGEAASDAFERVWAKVVSYRIFPTECVRFAIYPEGRITKGALIVQRFPLGWLAAEAAVRVAEIWDRRVGNSRIAGFRYITLAGHPERGVETFEIQLQPGGRATVRITARSEPGSFATRIGRHVARRRQVSATKAALRSLTEP